MMLFQCDVIWNIIFNLWCIYQDILQANIFGEAISPKLTLFASFKWPFRFISHTCCIFPDKWQTCTFYLYVIHENQRTELFPSRSLPALLCSSPLQHVLQSASGVTYYQITHFMNSDLSRFIFFCSCNLYVTCWMNTFRLPFIICSIY